MMALLPAARRQADRAVPGAEKGTQTDISFLDGQRVKLSYRLPLNEIVEDFSNRVTANRIS
jgi:translation elongation factor EF-4